LGGLKKDPGYRILSGKKGSWDPLLGLKIGIYVKDTSKKSSTTSGLFLRKLKNTKIEDKKHEKVVKKTNVFLLFWV
jgi:hypothetical protein